MYSRAVSQQAQVLTDIMPFVRAEERFALKGGTALNFFWFNLPRLSVDLDLVYLPVSPRPTFLMETGQALHRIAAKIRQADPSTTVTFKQAPHSSTFGKLYCRQQGVEVKVEVAMGQRQHPTLFLASCLEKGLACQLNTG